MAEAIGAGAGNAVRVLAGGKSRRILGGVRAGGSTFFGNLRHVLGLLFLEVTGSIFLLFAFGIAGKAWSEYQAYHSGKQGPGRFEFTLLLALMFLYFGVSSFWRSRRKAKR